MALPCTPALVPTSRPRWDASFRTYRLPNIEARVIDTSGPILYAVAYGRMARHLLPWSERQAGVAKRVAPRHEGRSSQMDYRRSPLCEGFSSVAVIGRAGWSSNASMAGRRLSGDAGGEKRFTGRPSRSHRNFVQFHLIELPSTSLRCDLTNWKTVSSE